MAETQDLSKIAILIPSYNPDEQMLRYVSALKKSGFGHIIVVNDGSKSDTLHFFEKAQEVLQNDGVVLHHYANEGKGRALKTGLHYFGKNFSHFSGVVTADADGQHSVRDTRKVAKTLLKSMGESALVLGTRDFNKENVPPKSSFGNKTTTAVFSAFFGEKILDTQTGLRAIPTRYVRQFIALKGERFEYEINMLIHAVNTKIDIEQAPIETIYFESNRATHFSAVKDSLRIYGVIVTQFLLFSLTGFASFLIDILLFFGIVTLFEGSAPTATLIFVATVVARFLSSIFNYSFAKTMVFKNKEHSAWITVKYYLLWSVQLTLSWFLVFLTESVISLDVTLLKIFVDLCLFFISFRIQKRFIFPQK